MDYQCVVVYTVIKINPPNVRINKDTEIGCLSWMKNKVKSILDVHLNAVKHSSVNGVAYGNLACLYYQQGLLDLAISTYRHAIDLHPDFPDAYCNLANALKEKGDVKEAKKCYEAALSLCPTHVDTLNNLGNVMREEGNVCGADKLYRKALEIHPGFAATHSNLASLLQQQGNLSQALKHYRKAINIEPLFADAFSNMGNTLRELNDLRGALKCFQKAIDINPTFADAYCNLGSIYKEIGNVEKAVQCYKTALQINSNFPDAYCSLVHSLQVVCDWNNYDQRMQNVVKIIEDQLEKDHVPSIHPHHSMLYPLTPKARKAIAQYHFRLYLDKVSSLNNIRYDYVPWTGRLRVGYVSSDFGNHPTSHLMQSIPGLHDRSKVEIFCYSLNPGDGTTFRSKIENEAEHFIDLSGMSDHASVAQMINRDGIHILINMNGYTKGARNEVFALKPAAVQVMWLGYPGTSGAEYMDYIITDKVSSPIAHEDHFSEKFAYMPSTYFIGDHKQMFPHLMEKFNVKLRDCNPVTKDIVNCRELVALKEKFEVETITKIYENDCDSESIMMEEKNIYIPEEIYEQLTNTKLKQDKTSIRGMSIYNGSFISIIKPKIGTGEENMDGIVFTSRSHYGLPDDAVIYCNFNQLYKIDPNTMKMWFNILKEVPKSILWLLSFPVSGQKNIDAFAAQHGVEPERIVFSKIACKEEHVRRGQLADVCLDTPLCNGHTTNMDILWAGIPVVTMPGKTLASRVAASQLTALGCQELIATSTKHYQDLAIRLGMDRKYREFMTAKVRRARLSSTLFDCKDYTYRLEQLYQEMMKIYEAKLPLDHISLI